MSLKIGLNLLKNYSINFDKSKRSKNTIKFIIIHYTGMKKESEAIKRLCDAKSKVSSHYFIKNSGKVLNLVPDLYIAWHAGSSRWKNLKSLNRYSIGIEINNPGHNHIYKKFYLKQIVSLNRLLKYLMQRYNIKKQNILGHSDIAPIRKKDPGEKFPWKILAKKNLCVWHNLDENKIKVFRKNKLSVKEEINFFQNLHKIGYSKIKKNNSNNNNKYLIEAFQRRFRQGLINGKMDMECFLISKNLLKQ
jgi:N-acetylmuramoyl-L-alanine amidase